MARYCRCCHVYRYSWIDLIAFSFEHKMITLKSGCGAVNLSLTVVGRHCHRADKITSL